MAPHRLAEIRNAAADALRSQKASLEDGFQRQVRGQVEQVVEDAEKRIAAAGAKQKVAEEDAERIREDGAFKEVETKLAVSVKEAKKAEGRANILEAQVKRYDDK